MFNVAICLALALAAAAQAQHGATSSAHHRPQPGTVGPLPPRRFEVHDPGLVHATQFGAPVSFAGPILAFVAGEAANAADLNGDGDASDLVPHVYDGRTGTLTSLGWSVGASLSSWAGEDVCAFLPHETWVGADLDGDGQLNHFVPQLFVTATRQVVNTGGEANEGSTFEGMTAHGPRDLAYGFQDASSVTSCFDVPTSTLHVLPGASGPFQVFGRRFFYGGSTLHVLDLDTAITTPIGPYSVLRSGTDLTLLQQREWLVVADLNHDGDMRDVVVSIRDETAGTLFGTELALTDLDRLFWPLDFVAAYDDLVTFGVWENAQGETDLNGNGHLGDTVLHFYDQASQTVIPTTSLGYGRGLDVWDQKVMFTHTSPELKMWDIATSSFVSTGMVSAAPRSRGNKGRRALGIVESASNGDLNGDGDFAGDEVLHLFDVNTPSLVNCGLAVGDVRMGRRHVAFTVLENKQARDLNGDGDLLDAILHIRWLGSGETVNTGVAGSIPSDDSASPAPDQGDELGPWIPFRTADDRPLLIRVL